MGGHCSRAAPAERVQNQRPGLCVFFYLSRYQRQWLLRRMKPLRVLRRKLPPLGVSVKTAPGILAHRHREPLADSQLSPYVEAPCRRQLEIIAAPYYLLFTHAEKLREHLITRGDVPIMNFFLYFVAQVPPVRSTERFSVFVLLPPPTVAQGRIISPPPP